MSSRLSLSSALRLKVPSAAVTLKSLGRSKKERASAQKTIAQYIMKPPLCTSTVLEASSQPFDARGQEGWEAA